MSIAEFGVVCTDSTRYLLLLVLSCVLLLLLDIIIESSSRDFVAVDIIVAAVDKMIG